MKHFALAALCALVLTSACAGSETAYRRALRADSTEAYREFLRDHGGSEFSVEIERRLEDRWYQDIKEARRVARFAPPDVALMATEYLATYPSGRWTKVVRATLEEVEAELRVVALSPVPLLDDFAGGEERVGDLGSGAFTLEPGTIRFARLGDAAPTAGDRLVSAEVLIETKPPLPPVHLFVAQIKNGATVVLGMEVERAVSSGTWHLVGWVSGATQSGAVVKLPFDLAFTITATARRYDAADATALARAYAEYERLAVAREEERESGALCRSSKPEMLARCSELTAEAELLRRLVRRAATLLHAIANAAKGSGDPEGKRVAGVFFKEHPEASALVAKAAKKGPPAEGGAGDAPPAPPATDAGAPERASLRVEFALGRSVLSSGERLPVTVRVRNVGEEPVVVHALQDAFLSATVIAEGGVSIPCWKVSSPPAPDGHLYTRLPSAGVMRLETDLARLCPAAARLKPGRYRIELLWNVPSWYDGSLFGLAAWTGSMLSGDQLFDVNGLPSAKPAVKVPAASLALELVAASPPLVAGDPIPLRLRLSNRGTVPVVVAPLDPAGVELHVTTPFGFTHRCRPAPGHGAAAASEFATLGASAALGTSLRLDTLCGLRSAGTYFVRARYRAKDDGRRHAFAAWTGDVTSESITFVVTPRRASPPVELLAHLERGAVKAGAAVSLKVVLENDAPEPLWVPVHPSLFRVRITERGGGVVPCREPAKFPAKLPAGAYKKIEPGAKIVHSVNLSGACALSTPGVYDVVAAYLVPPRFSPPPKLALAFSGRATAPAVELMVESAKMPVHRRAVEMLARVAAPVVAPFEPVYVDVAIRNGGRGAVPMFRFHRALLSFSVDSPTGDKWRCAPEATRPSASAASFYRLPPGAAVGDRIDLREACGSKKLTAPGTYKVTARFSIPDGLDGSAFGIEGVKGNLEAKPFTVEVVEPGGKPEKLAVTIAGARTVVAGDDVAVRVTLKNLGKRTASVQPWPGEQLSVVVTAPDGTNRVCRSGAPAKAAAVRLLPGKSVGWTGTLAEACAGPVVSGDGTYRVGVEHTPTKTFAARPLVIVARKAPAAKTAVAAAPPVTPPGPPTRVKLVLRGPRVLSAPAEGPIPFEMILSNEGGDAVRTARFSPWYVGFDVVAVDGTRPRCRDHVDPRPDFSEDVIAPGATRALSVDLRRWCVKLPPGRYRVAPRAVFPRPAKAAGTWWGEVVSSGVWLDVAAVPGTAVAAGAPGKGDGPAAPVPADGGARLRLEVVPAETSVALGKPIKVKAILHNVGSRGVLVDVMHPSHVRARIVRVAADGKALSPVPCKGAPPPMGRARSVLPPGKSVEVTLDVAAGCRIGGPGAYRVSLRAAFPAPTLSSPMSGETVLFAGDVIADPFEVNVIPAGADAADKGPTAVAVEPTGKGVGDPGAKDPGAKAGPEETGESKAPAPIKGSGTVAPDPAAKKAPDGKTGPTTDKAPAKKVPTAKPVPTEAKMPPTGRVPPKGKLRIAARPASDTWIIGEDLTVNVKLVGTSDTVGVLERPLRFLLRLKSVADPSVKRVCGGVEPRVDATTVVDHLASRPEFSCKPPAAGKYRALLGYRTSAGPVLWSAPFDINVATK